MHQRIRPTSKDSNNIEFTSVLPYLYRYENEQYKKYTDNQLGDTGEGYIVHWIETRDNNTMVALTTLGDNCYSFCTSTMLHKDLFETFSRNSVFRIFDHGNFMAAINKCIPRLLGVCYGNCLYIDKRVDFQKRQP